MLRHASKCAGEKIRDSDPHEIERLTQENEQMRLALIDACRELRRICESPLFGGGGPQSNETHALLAGEAALIVA